ncbi:hypothetical protein AS159_04345 [Thermotoga sp. Ku-13t]|nr:hypothetical protein AS159_04345 [Thermotoga sp. Ku-13t]
MIKTFPRHNDIKRRKFFQEPFVFLHMTTSFMKQISVVGFFLEHDAISSAQSHVRNVCDEQSTRMLFHFFNDRIWHRLWFQDLVYAPTLRDEPFKYLSGAQTIHVFPALKHFARQSFIHHEHFFVKFLPYLLGEGNALEGLLRVSTTHRKSDADHNC